MTILAGIVTTGETKPADNASLRMLSWVNAPNHALAFNFANAHGDVSSRYTEERAAFYSENDICIIGDVRLRNKESLGERLGVNSSDLNCGQLIWMAYQQFGEDLPLHLQGEFAIVVWEVSNQRVFCCRDRFGVMPLSYEITDTSFRFSSDFKALAMSHSDQPGINTDWVVEYVRGGTGKQSTTPFEGIFRLPPGCRLLWKKGETEISKYWSFANIPPQQNEIPIEALRSALELAVRNRNRHGDAGALLSGGLDSSSLCIILRDQLQENGDARSLQTVSLVFDETPDESERAYIEDVLETGAFEPIITSVSVQPVTDAIRRIIQIQGAPTLAAGTPVFENALKAAAGSGLTKLLDGHGGDEVISSRGFMRLLELADRGQWASLIREIVPLSTDFRPSLLEYFSGIYGSRRKGPIARLFRKVNRLYRSGEKPKTHEEFLASNWRNSALLEEIDSRLYAMTLSKFKTEREYQRSVLEHPLQARGFEELTRLYRSYGLEVEFPYWDQDVVEACYQAPSEQKYANGLTRGLLRAVMQDRLPSPILNRTDKFDFTGHLLRGLKLCREELEELADDANSALGKYVDVNVFRTAIAQLDDEQTIITTETAMGIWRCASLAIWLNWLDKKFPTGNKALEVRC